MDKFGIFKLLNSFLSKNDLSAPADKPKNQLPNDFLSQLFSSLKEKENANDLKTNTGKNQPATKARTAPPLQSSMLRTMNSHDAIIKRVKEKNPF